MSYFVSLYASFSTFRMFHVANVCFVDLCSFFFVGFLLNSCCMISCISLVFHELLYYVIRQMLCLGPNINISFCVYLVCSVSIYPSMAFLML